jgi:hypothetical protein
MTASSPPVECPDIDVDVRPIDVLTAAEELTDDQEVPHLEMTGRQRLDQSERKLAVRLDQPPQQFLAPHARVEGSRDIAIQGTSNDLRQTLRAGATLVAIAEPLDVHS